MKRAASLIVALALVSGCSGYSLEELRRTPPKGSEFNQHLTQRYLDEAETQARAYDWAVSARFAEKGLLAAYDSEVGPEEVAGYTADAALAAELEKARAELLPLLSDKNRSERPAVAAEAIFFFDCWLERAAEATRADDIAYCRDRFRDRVDELADTSYEAVLKEAGEPVAAVDTTSYIVFFGWGETRVSEAGEQVVASAAQQLADQEGYEVVLNGHTDLSGDAKYNLRLSKRRAEAVKARLVSHGVREEAIRVFAYGESDPVVKTADSKPEAQNRRVEIFLGE